jgi:hypothetical protein
MAFAIGERGYALAVGLVLGLFVWTVLVGVVASGRVARIRRLLVATSSRFGPDAEPVSIQRIARLFSLCCLAIGLVFVAASLAVTGGRNGAAAGFWAAGIVAFLATLHTAEPFRSSGPRTRSRTWWLLTCSAGAALLATGLVFRTIRLDLYPTGMHGDEANFALSALQLLDGSREMNLFGSELFHGHPSVFAFLQAAVGRDLLGLSVPALAFAATIVLGVSTAIDAQWYFSDRTDHYVWRVHAEAGKLMRELERNHDVVFLGPPDVGSDYEAVRFASQGAHVVDVADVTSVIPLRPSLDRSTAFILTPGHFADLETIRAAHPFGILHERVDRSGRPLVKVFFAAPRPSDALCSRGVR